VARKQGDLARGAAGGDVGAFNAGDGAQGVNDLAGLANEADEESAFPAGIEVAGENRLNTGLLGNALFHQGTDGPAELFAKLGLSGTAGTKAYCYGVHRFTAL
jgi:hypothetical protein